MGTSEMLNRDQTDAGPESEEKRERIPSLEEVRSLFERKVGEAKLEEVRRLEDERGLYLWEVRIVQKDGSVEYSYVRKGDYKSRGLAGGSASETAIHVTYFDNDEIPISGSSLFKLFGDEWVETS